MKNNTFLFGFYFVRFMTFSWVRPTHTQTERDNKVPLHQLTIQPVFMYSYYMKILL
jgi:hypothetical protein